MYIDVTLDRIKGLVHLPPSFSRVAFNFECEYETLDIQVGSEIFTFNVVPFIGKINPITSSILISNGVIFKHRYGNMNITSIKVHFSSTADACKFKLKM